MAGRLADDLKTSPRVASGPAFVRPLAWALPVRVMGVELLLSPETWTSLQGLRGPG